ncbi:metallophosphoesterase family protein [Halioxenophilus sp. WMMB6]|uniref:metallophosphoesterase family protein n=1 Tax=Halioxenophilus sp. WMMB6 TaxID=3073815 RepID=UPI00295E4450|nr:metallophosphoesterase family protein [Halioxenophilus sp. WMMB6]
MLPSLGGAILITEQQLRDVLNCPVALARNSEFLGRPATQLFADDHLVAKLRSDFVFRPVDVERKAQAARAQEITVAVYHPSKTWFYLRDGDDLVIGSVMPKLEPLHLAFERMLSGPECDLVSLLRQWFRLYFSVAAQHKKRLDEGLSNFGLDENGRLYYLDDDLYAWYDFTAFSCMFAVWCRQYPTISEDFCRVLIRCLVEQLLEHFASPHLLRVVYGQVRDLDAYNDRERRLFSLVVELLAAEIKRFNTTLIKSDLGLVDDASVADSSLGGEDPSCNEPGIMAVLADVHANAPALEAVLAELDRLGVKKILLLGDVVGYGPHPNECIELIQARSCLTVQGNHDYAAVSGDVHRGFSKMARWAIEWTQPRLSIESKQFLSSLPPQLRIGSWLAVHGAPIDKHFFYAYVYQMTYQANLDWLQSHEVPIAFHGHSHTQSVYQRFRREDYHFKEGDVQLRESSWSLVCPGSVGQPRCGDWRAEFALFDPASASVKFRKLKYDLQYTMTDMRQLGFPSALVDRYADGK